METTTIFWTEEKILELKDLFKTHTNAELAEHFNTTKQHIRYSLNFFQIKRTKEQKKFLLRNQNQKGENNHNWKGGISKENYRYRRQQVERYPERIKAERVLNGAVRSGKIIRGPCEINDETCRGKVQGFIPDKKRPLETVRWFCRKHNYELNH